MRAWWLLFGLLAALLSAVSGALLAVIYQPLPPSRLAFMATQVLAADGSVLARRLSRDGYWREAVQLDDIDPRLLALLIAYEDQRFWQHPGVDVWALARALTDAVLGGELRSGASTLTMQTARLMYPELGRKSIAGKWQQMLMALRLEHHWSKQQILQAYFTLAPYGSNIEGVMAASQAWFGRKPLQLTWREASLLVALPQSPERRRPDRFPGEAAAASARVLSTVADRLNFTPQQIEEWRQEPLPLRIAPFQLGDGHLLDRLTDASGGSWHTSIDSHWQQQAKQLLQQALRALPDSHNGALLLVERATGRIKVYLGSSDYQQQARKGAINYLTTLRSTGSTLKPLIYGLALQRGLLQPDSLLRDGEIQVDGYRPQNFDSGFYGEVSLYQALQQSLNIPAVTTLERLDADIVVRQIEQFLDLSSQQLNDPGLALAVGAGYLSAEQLAQLYLGLFQQPSAQLSFAAQAVPRTQASLLNQQSSQQLLNLLAHFPPPDAARQQQTPIPVYKTGTSNGRRDAWSVHVSAEHLLVVWLGAPDNQSSEVLSGASHAAPLGQQLLQSLQLAAPSGLQPPQRVAQQTRPSTGACPRLIEFPEHDEWLLSEGLIIRVGSRYAGLQWYVNGQRVELLPGQGLQLPTAGAHRISARQGDCVTSHSVFLQLTRSAP